MNRRLSPAEQTQLVEEYRGGRSTYELAHQFRIHRRTVVTHLERHGVPVRPQLKMTPTVVEQAKRLYADGHSLAAIGDDLGVDATTVLNALKKAGVNLRDTHGRPR
ncbi:helix-turn-helix domain containing protein [Mycolicibacterium agri]|nr:helix-turn-helix domain containing protein [Mycolicibacterium agri]